MLTTLRTLIFMLIFNIWTVASFAQVGCTNDTPSFTVDLSASGTATWTTPTITNAGNCCNGGANRTNCFQLAVILAPNSIGVTVTPTGSITGTNYYQTNCGATPVAMANNTQICLANDAPQQITICNDNVNTTSYTITSIPGPSVVQSNITTGVGCHATLQTTNFQAASITWNSISPGAPGAYNTYLSNAAGNIWGVAGTPFSIATNPRFTAPVGSPTQITYVVCGNPNPVNSCFTGPVCDTVTITVLPDLALSIAPTNPVICYGEYSVPLTATIASGTPPYTYLWNNGQNTPILNATSPGTYSVTVTDASGCQTETQSITVTQITTPISANAGADISRCPTATGSIQLNGSLTGTTTGVWSGGLGTFSPDNFTLNATYTPTAAEIANGTITLTLTPTTTTGCTVASDNVSIIYQQLAAAPDNVTNVPCNVGANLGSAIIGVTGGTAPYIYSLNGGTSQLSNTFSNLTESNYSVHVTDASGCTAVTTFTITRPPALAVSTIPTNISCFGVCDGAVQVNVTGGVAPYLYHADGFTAPSASNTITDLCAGLTNIIITDANGCTRNQPITLTAPTQLNATFSHVNPTCVDLCNASITANATGGVAPYQYLIQNGTAQASNTISNLCDGYQIAIVRDANGCEVSNTIQIVDPNPMTVTNTTSPSNCGFPNGSVTFTAAGPNAPFMYNFNNGGFGSTTTFSNLNAGAYPLIVQDAIGCTYNTTLGISDVEMTGSLQSIQHVSCFGANDGEFVAINNSGVPPIQYQHPVTNNMQSNGTFENLDGGEYMVIIVDNGYCLFALPVDVIEPDPIQFIATPTNVVCNGASTGSISVGNIIGGNANFQYSIDGGNTYQTSNVFTGLAAGTYTITVRDDKNCTGTSTVTITQPAPVQIAFTQDPIACNGGTTAIIITATGQNGPFQYSINGGTTYSNIPLFENLTAGTYPVALLNANNCTTTQTITVVQPATLISSTPTVTNVSCAGTTGCDGQVLFDVTGGTTPYHISLDGGTTSLTNLLHTGLCSGSYTAEITDNNGCLVNTTFEIAAPTALTATTTTVEARCAEDNGKITFTVAGGTAPYLFSIDNGITFDIDTFVIENLAHGTYFTVVQDANGCEFETQVNVNNAEPPVIVNIQATAPLCNTSCEGVIEITAEGGLAPLIYTVSGQFGPETIFPDLCAGTHPISVMDQNGCVVTTDATISAPTPVVAQITSTNLTCNNNGTGTITVTGTGGTAPYTYSLDNGANWGVNNTMNMLAAGTYTLLVRDANNCPATNSVTLTEPTPVTMQPITFENPICANLCDGIASILPAGGTAPYTYEWHNNALDIVSTAQAPNTLCGETYTGTVFDANGCFVSGTVTLTNPPAFEITALNVNAPLCSGNCNGVIEITAPNAVSYSFDNGTTIVTNNTNNTVCAGTYTIQAINVDGCISDSIVSIVAPDSLAITVSDDVTVCFEEQVTLSTTITGGVAPYTYVWNTTLANDNTQATITFDAATTGYISVTATDVNGCTIQDSVLVTVHPVLQVDITPNTTICPGEELELSVNVTAGLAPYNYQWTGPAISVANAINVTPTQATTYSVTVTDGCGSETYTIDVNLFTIPALTITPDVLEGCSPVVSTITPTFGAGFDNTNCSWDFGDGNTSTVCGPVSHTFTGSTCYTVQLTTQTTDGCEVTVSTVDQICVNPTPTVLTIDDLVVCSGGAVNLDANAAGGTEPYNYSWSFGSTIPNVTINPTASALHTVTVTDANGCTAQDDVTISINTPLSASIVSNPTVCPGTPATLQVLLNNGTAPINYQWPGAPLSPNNTFTVTPNAPTNYNVTVIDACGSQTLTFNVGTFTVPVVPVTVDEAVGCSPHTAVITATLPATVNNNNCIWTLPDGTTINTCDPISQTFTAANCYDIQFSATSTDGCAVITNMNDLVCVNENPVIDAGNPATFCNGTQVQLNALASQGTAPYTYLWNNGAVTSNPTVVPSATGYATVTVEDANGCTGSDSVLLTMNAILQPTLTPNLAICPGEDAVLTVTATGTAPITYQWVGMPGETTNTVTVSPAATTTYSVIVTDGCTQQTLSVQVAVRILPALSFTPDVANGCAPHAATITPVLDAQMDNQSCIWTLPDGTQINTCDPLQVNYSTPNCYSYTLSAQTVDGCLVTATQNDVICVFDNPSVSTNDDQSICASANLTLTSTTTGGLAPYTYVWSNGSVAPTTLVSPQQEETYTVIATDMNGCTGTDSVTISINPQLAATITPDTTICPGGTATIVANITSGVEPYIYNWQAPLSNMTPTAIVNPSVTTTYLITVSDVCSSMILSATVNVSQLPTITLTPNAVEGCAPHTGQIIANIGNQIDNTSCIWTLSDGTVINGCDPINPEFTIPDCYDVTMTANTLTGCPVTVTQNDIICVNPVPMVTAIDDLVICRNTPTILSAIATGGQAPYQYSWSTGATTQTIAVTPQQTQNYVVVAQDVNGCQSSDTVLVTLNPNLNFNLPADTLVCPNSDLIININPQGGVAPYNIMWQSPQGIVGSQATINVTQPTMVIVQVADQCESLVRMMSVNLLPDPTLQLNLEDLQGCIPFEANIVGTLNNTNFQGPATWTFSNGTVVNGTNNVSQLFTQEGCYGLTVTGTTTEGCPINFSQNNIICAHPQPVANFTFSPENPTTLDLNLTLENNSTGGEYYSWVIDNQPSISYQDPILNIEGSPDGRVIYACLTANNQYGCVSEFCNSVTFREAFTIYVPNAFTPNQTALNNTFIPVFGPKVNIHDYTFQVFNRWNQLVFESKDPYVGWTGTYNQFEAPDGTYTWKIVVKEGLNYEEHSFIGHVTLIR